MLKDFIAVDIETTGLDKNHDHIIEIAAIRFENGTERDVFSSLVNPGCSISPFIIQLTGIRNEDLKNASSIQDILHRFHQFIRDLPLLFYNAPFDTGFIQRESLAAGLTLTNPILDVLLIARAAWPFLPSYKLKDMALTWQIDVQQIHRAESDARVTGQVYLKLNQFWVAQSVDILNVVANFFVNTPSVYTEYFRSLLQSKTQVPSSASEYHYQLPQPGSNFIPGGISDFSFPVELKEWFLPGGLISQHLGNYEYRHIQEIMAEFIMETFTTDTIGIAEAATGTGKSFAYLIPAIAFAAHQQVPVLISTKTKTLQDQLFFKDIPFIHQLTHHSFSAAILKGKNNYFCLKKYFQCLEYQVSHLPLPIREQILPAVIYQAQTRTGDLAELGKSDPGRMVSRFFAADAISCFPRTCPHKKNCYYYLARFQAMQAQLVITNHSLLMAELSIENSFIHEFQHIVIDEAHHLEKVAVSFLGHDLSFNQIQGILDYFFLNSHESSNLIKRLLRQIQQQGLYSFEEMAVLDTTINELVIYARRLELESMSLFEQMKVCAQDTKSTNYSIHYRVRQAFSEESPAMMLYIRMQKLLTTIQSSIKSINTMLEDKAKEFGLEDYQAGLNSCCLQLTETQQFLDGFLQCHGDNLVHWIESDEKEKLLVLHSWPIQIDQILQDQLFTSVKSIILVSATLTINQNFTYFKRRLGLENMELEKVRELILDPVFQMDHQVMICLPTFLPDPTQTEAFTAQAAEMLHQILPAHKKGCLILFTSYSMMQDFYNKMKNPFELQQVKLLMQNRKSSIHFLLKEFKEDFSSVLLGTESFWEGIDVPGKALEILVITKLPFQVPDEPIIEARLEYLQKQNKNPFYHYTLPESIIRLKQGIGRLIRHREDTGIILILDKRVHTASYGKFIENSLPVPLTLVNSLTEMDKLISGWFHN